jgi:two-component system, OmpR family, sensor kinase
MKLYLRIWLAVLASIALTMLIAGAFIRQHNEHLREQFRDGAVRDMVIRNSNQEIVGRAVRESSPGARGFSIQLHSGERFFIELPNRPLRPVPPWYFSPWGFFAMLGLIALAVAMGAYPIARRLTRRLEVLSGGVDAWGDGKLSVRVPVEGSDEVAFLAQKFNHAASQVEALMGAHKSLLANASHELRSPLARIRMALTLLQAWPDKTSEASSKDQPSATISEINQNIQELDSLIEEILLASRLDSPEASIGTPESFDLLGLAAEECARTNAELIVADNTQGTFELTGYPRLVRRLLRNLLENANRHNQIDKGGVSLELTNAKSTAGQSAALVITVLDQGAGVAADECERIFEPFYRARNASERDGGVGLGLALVKSIAQRHGGSAVCEDTHGLGGRFVIRLAAA